jgi:hypothetical protein
MGVVVQLHATSGEKEVEGGINIRAPVAAGFCQLVTGNSPALFCHPTATLVRKRNLKNRDHEPVIAAGLKITQNSDRQTQTPQPSHHTLKCPLQC